MDACTLRRAGGEDILLLGACIAAVGLRQTCAAGFAVLSTRSSGCAGVPVHAAHMGLQVERKNTCENTPLVVQMAALHCEFCLAQASHSWVADTWLRRALRQNLLFHTCFCLALKRQEGFLIKAGPVACIAFSCHVLSGTQQTPHLRTQLPRYCDFTFLPFMRLRLTCNSLIRTAQMTSKQLICSQSGR